MRKLVIIGTGAVSAELTSYIHDNNKHVSDEAKIDITGYVEYDYNIEKFWKTYQLEAPVLGDLDNYSFPADIEVLIAISDNNFKKFVIDTLKPKTIRYANFIHHSVIVDHTLKLGTGNIIYPFSIIGPNVTIGDFNLVTSYSFISHDCTIGCKNFLSTAGLAGRVKIGDDNFLGIRSAILPGVKIGNRNTIQAGMIVDKDINDDSTVFYRYKEQILAVPKQSN